MIIYFTIIIPIIYVLLLSSISRYYRSLYNKIGDLELKLIDLEYKLNNFEDKKNGSNN